MHTRNTPTEESELKYQLLAAHPCRYALSFLLREMGTLTGPIGEFLEYVHTTPTPAAQLKLVNADAALSVDQRDAVIYTMLDRATLLKRLLRAGPDAEQRVAQQPDAPSSSAQARAPGETEPQAFHGPVAALLPRDRLGAKFLEAAGEEHVALEQRHTECLLSEPARRATAERVAQAVAGLLQRLARQPPADA